MFCIEDSYTEILVTKVRNTATPKDELQNALRLLGQRMGQIISSELFSEKCEITTPMGYKHIGLCTIPHNTVIISTRDDYNYFAEGIQSTMNNVVRGYMDFEGRRGKDALSSPIRSMSLPEPRKEFPTDSVIIAKSVLATGCTAISLTRKAVEMYNPRNVIIASIFYSDIGIAEMLNEISTAQIFTFGKADSLDENGMLIPGVGNLDQRLKA